MARSKRKLLKKRRTRKQKGGNKLKLIVKLTGGLGNRFFQIMAGLGFAEKWGNYNVYIKDIGSNHVSKEVSNKHILQLFANVNPQLQYISTNLNTSSFIHLKEKDPHSYNDISNPNSDCLLEGYFVGEQYFPKNPPKLNLLEPNNNIIKNVNKDKLFFIHIRLGDFNNNENLILPLQYYKDAIKKILEKYVDSIFIVLSADVIAVKKYVEDNFSLPPTFLETPAASVRIESNQIVIG